MTHQIVSKITQKGQATIPVAIRNFLNISSGGFVCFQIMNNKVVVNKVEPLDKNYLLALQNTLSTEWSSEADNKAFNDL